MRAFVIAGFAFYHPLDLLLRSRRKYAMRMAWGDDKAIDKAFHRSPECEYEGFEQEVVGRLFTELTAILEERRNGRLRVAVLVRPSVLLETVRMLGRQHGFVVTSGHSIMAFSV